MTGDAAVPAERTRSTAVLAEEGWACATETRMQTRSDATTTNGSGMLADALIGAAAGALGVWVMDRFDWFMWSRESPETRRRTTAARPGGESPAHAVATKLKTLVGADGSGSAEVAEKIERLDAQGLWGDRHHVAGTAVHYGIGMGPAAIYGIYRDKLPLSGAARGALYGLTIFLTHDEAVNAMTGLSGRPQDYPWQAHARGLITHLVYGVVTDAATSVLKKQVRSRRDQEQPRVVVH